MYGVLCLLLWLPPTVKLTTKQRHKLDSDSGCEAFPLTTLSLILTCTSKLCYEKYGCMHTYPHDISCSRYSPVHGSRSTQGRGLQLLCWLVELWCTTLWTISWKGAVYVEQVVLLIIIILVHNYMCGHNRLACCVNTVTHITLFAWLMCTFPNYVTLSWSLLNCIHRKCFVENILLQVVSWNSLSYFGSMFIVFNKML